MELDTLTDLASLLVIRESLYPPLVRVREVHRFAIQSEANRVSTAVGLHTINHCHLEILIGFILA